MNQVESCSIVDDQSIVLTQNVPAEDNKDIVNRSTDLEEFDEDEMLKKAIAMSLEEETGVILQKEKTRLSTTSFRWHAGRDNF